MTEFELKLEVPPARLQALAAAIRQGQARRQRLRATYFDTQDSALAAQGIVVRVRQEGRRWVQTAKAPGSGLLHRLEHNVAVPSSQGGTLPAPDLARHDGTPVGETVRHALGLKANAAFPPLVALYETDVTRLAATVRFAESDIEIALDQGHIVARQHSLPVCELEIELKQGRPEDAVQLARQGCALHGLWLSTLTKSMKGQRLAGTGAREKHPERIASGRHASGPELARAVIGACLEHVVQFASEVASGSENAEHVHQLRVGLRRLRTALRELAAVTAGIDPAWEAPLADAFRSLGSHRDRSHLERTVEPLIRDAGGPAVAATAPAAGDPGPVDAVRAPAFQDSLFCLLAFAQSETAAPSPDHRETRRKLGSALARLHRQVLRDGARFAALDDARQHRVRKRAKRLRYLSEFAAPLFGSRLTQRFAHALTPVQDALGWYNDEVTALRAYRSIVTTQPQAWFAAGWLSARRENNALLCQRAMGQFARVPPFWE